MQRTRSIAAALAGVPFGLIYGITARIATSAWSDGDGRPMLGPCAVNVGQAAQTGTCGHA